MSKSETKSEVPRILRDPEVKQRTGRSRVQRWRDIRTGKFPAPVKIGPNAVGWLAGEIDEWIANRPRVHYAASTSSPSTDGAQQATSGAATIDQPSPEGREPEPQLPTRQGPAQPRRGPKRTKAITPPAG